MALSAARRHGDSDDGGGVVGSPEDVLYEVDVSVSEELQNCNLENFGKRAVWCGLDFLTFHLH